jgi:hypothetical protein
VTPAARLPIPGPLRSGDILDRAFRLYRARFWPLLGIASLCLAPVGVLTALVTGQTMTSLMGLATTTRGRAAPDLDAVFGPLLGFFGLTLVLSLLAMLASGLATLVLIVQTTGTLHGQPPEVSASFRQGVRRLLPLIGMALLMGLGMIVAVIGVILLIACVAGVVGVALAAAFQGRNLGGVAMVGAVVLVLVAYLGAVVLALAPIVYLGARWVAAVPALMVEALGPVEALRRSWGLTRRRVWRCVGFVVLLGVLSMIVGAIPVAVIQQVVVVMVGPTQIGWAIGISTALGQLVTIVWLPLQVAAVVLLYYDLRVRGESYDLALQIERLETQARAPGDLPVGQEPGP